MKGNLKVTTKKLIVTVSEGLFGKLEARAETEDYLSVQDFVRSILKREVEGAGEGVVREKSEKKKDPLAMFSKTERGFLLRRDPNEVGERCEGSLQVLEVPPEVNPLDNFPYVMCPFCNQNRTFGGVRLKDGTGTMMLREHLISQKEDVEPVEVYGTIVGKEKHDRDVVEGGGE